MRDSVHVAGGGAENTRWNPYKRQLCLRGTCASTSFRFFFFWKEIKCSRSSGNKNFGSVATIGIPEILISVVFNSTTVRSAHDASGLENAVSTQWRRKEDTRWNAWTHSGDRSFAMTTQLLLRAGDKERGSQSGLVASTGDSWVDEHEPTERQLV